MWCCGVVVFAANRASAPFTHSFAEVEALGQKQVAAFPDVVPQPNDLVTICYTSGTTGNPKVRARATHLSPVRCVRLQPSADCGVA